MQKIDLLFDALGDRRTACGVTAVVLSIDDDVQAVVVKSVVSTSAFAGYPDVRFESRGAPDAAR